METKFQKSELKAETGVQLPESRQKEVERLRQENLALSTKLTAEREKKTIKCSEDKYYLKY